MFKALVKIPPAPNSIPAPKLQFWQQVRSKYNNRTGIVVGMEYRGFYPVPNDYRPDDVGSWVYVINWLDPQTAKTAPDEDDHLSYLYEDVLEDVLLEMTGNA